jgi:NADP-reducing hydrogenase subunit HndB
MSKINSFDDLKKLREASIGDTALRITGENHDRIVLAVGMATCGIAAGARKILDTLLEEVAAKKLENVSVVATGCFGFCRSEPMIEVRMPDKDPVCYGNVSEDLAKDIVNKHVMCGDILTSAIIGKE